MQLLDMRCHGKRMPLEAMPRSAMTLPNPAWGKPHALHRRQRWSRRLIDLLQDAAPATKSAICSCERAAGAELSQHVRTFF